MWIGRLTHLRQPLGLARQSQSSESFLVISGKRPRKPQSVRPKWPFHKPLTGRLVFRQAHPNIARVMLFVYVYSLERPLGQI